MAHEDRGRIATDAVDSQQNSLSSYMSGAATDPGQGTSASNESFNSRRHHATSSSISVDGRMTSIALGKGLPGSGRLFGGREGSHSDGQVYTAPARHRSSFSIQATSPQRHAVSPVSFRSATRPAHSLQPRTFLSRLFQYAKRKSLAEVTMQLVFLASVGMFSSALLGYGHDGSRTGVVLPLVQPKQLVRRWREDTKRDAFTGDSEAEDNLRRDTEVKEEEQGLRQVALVMEAEEDEDDYSIKDYIKLNDKPSEQHHAEPVVVDVQPGEHPFVKEEIGSRQHLMGQNEELRTIEGGEPNYFEHNLALKQKKQAPSSAEEPQSRRLDFPEQEQKEDPEGATTVVPEGAALDEADDKEPSFERVLEDEGRENEDAREMDVREDSGMKDDDDGGVAAGEDTADDDVDD